jgi:hypothetical protein
MRHQAADYFKAHLAFIVASFNVLVSWHGLLADKTGFVPISIAEFSL